MWHSCKACYTTSLSYLVLFFFWTMSLLQTILWISTDLCLEHNRCISEMSDCISVSAFKDCPACSRASRSKQHWFTTSFHGGGWAESCGAYGVGISNAILKPKRVMPAEELGSSSCLLCGKRKLQIPLLKRECLLHYPFQKWLFALTFRQFASSCCPLCCNGCCLYICICLCELVYF